MTMKQNSTTPKRPLSVTLLTWVVLILTSLNWLRLIEVIRGWKFLQSLTPAPPVLYLAIMGLFWGLVGAILVWGLFLGRAWSPRLMRNAAVSYALYYWLDRLLVADSSAISSRWPFALGMTIVLLAFTYWNFSRQKTQQFFNRSEN
jgi:hypothetical protein